MENAMGVGAGTVGFQLLYHYYYRNTSPFSLSQEDVMRSVRRVMAGSLLFLATSHPAFVLAQDTTRVAIQGVVLDAASGQPITGVVVSMDDLGITEVTDSDGAFAMSDIPLGPHQLTIRREGYEEMSGRLVVHQGGDMVLRMRSLGGPSGPGGSQVLGRVRDVDGGEPLEGVAVRFDPIGMVRETDSEGRFAFQGIPPGEYTMTAGRLGYSSREDQVVVGGGTVMTVEFTLAVDPIELDPIEVLVERLNPALDISGFYQRRQATSGTFLTREKIEDRAPLFTTDLFQGLAGVKVVGGLGMGTQKAVVVSGSRALSLSGGDPYSNPCYPAIWIDGQMVHAGSAGPVGSGPAFLDDLIQPEQIAGVEIYASAAQVPLQFNLFSACGVIVLWSRSGR